MKPSLYDYAVRFSQVAPMMLASGLNNECLRSGQDGRPTGTPREWRRFYAACHRGYEKGQDSILTVLGQLARDTVTPPRERRFYELCFRRLIDAVAWTILGTRSHVAKRFILDDNIPVLNFAILAQEKKRIDGLNSESRQTFALLAGLSTFLHAVDAIRVDLRRNKYAMSYIELKEGKVNVALEAALASYRPEEQEMQRIDHDPAIHDRFRSQAKRMLRQKIRLAQIDQIIRTDAGIQPGLNAPVQLAPTTHRIGTWGDALCQWIEGARQNGGCAGTVDSCIHVGVGLGDEYRAALHTAREFAIGAYRDARAKGPTELTSCRNEVLKLMWEDEMLSVRGDIFRGNLEAFACTPAPVWPIRRQDLNDLVAQRLSIVAVLDLGALLWMLRREGFEAQLSTRAEAERLRRAYGRKNTPTWAHRALLIGRGALLGGIIAHMLTGLDAPQEIVAALKQDDEWIDAQDRQ